VFFANFHFLGLFIDKKHLLSNKKLRLPRTAVAVAEICLDTRSVWLLVKLDEPFTQNFEIWNFKGTSSYTKVRLRMGNWKFLLATHGIWGKYWFSAEKNENFFSLIFISWCDDLSDKFLSVRHAPLPPPFAQICVTPTASALWARKLKFWLPESFGPTWCTSYSKFWNSGS
jgi:hypothetical protein